MEVGLGGTDVGVSQPERDDGGVDAGLQQRHRAAVSQYVGVKLFAVERRASLCRGGGVDADALLDGVAAESPAGAGRKQRVVGSAGTLGEPGREDCLGRRGEWDRALFAAFAFAAEVRARAERDVCAVEAGELGDAQPGLDGEHEQRAVAAAFPTSLIGRVDERFGLRGGEKRDGAFLVVLGWNREHPLDRCGVLGVAQRGVAKERPDRGQAQVAGPDAVAADGLEMLEERRDERLVEVLPAKRGGLGAGRVVGEAQQQPQRVAVGRDRLGAGLLWRARRSVKNACSVGATKVIATPLRRRADGRRGRATPARPTSTDTCTWARDARGRSTAMTVGLGRRHRRGTN